MTHPATRTGCSIVINSYNYGRFLERCIRSALAQAIPTEVVVVDDGSTDSSRSVIESFRGRITSVLQENSGQAVAMNAGVAAATGDVVAFLDADDWVSETKAVGIVDAFRRNPEVDWLRHDLVIAHGDRHSGQTLYSLPRSSTPFQDYLRWGDTAGTTSCLAFRREFLDVVGDVPADYSTYADAYLKLSAALLGNHLDLPDALGTRRIHDAQVTRRTNGTAQRVAARIAYRRDCADRAATIGGLLGEPDLAAKATWWQRRAVMHDLILRAAPRTRLSGWLAYSASLRASGLPPVSKAAFAAREGLLALTPRRAFPAVWWWTNDGRPALRRANSGVR